MADEPPKPAEQKPEPKKDTVRITLPPKIGTAAGAEARPGAPPVTPTVRLPAPPVTAAKAGEQPAVARKESDTKTLPGGAKKQTAGVKTDTSKVKTSPTPGVAARAAAPAAPVTAAPTAAVPAAPTAAAPRPTTVRLPSPAEVQQAAARQPVAPPAPVGAPVEAGIPAWVGFLAIGSAIVSAVAAAMLFFAMQTLSL
jgi:hypothetical protein